MIPSDIYGLERPRPINKDLRAASAILHPDAALHIQLKGINLTNVATGWVTNRTSSPIFELRAQKTGSMMQLGAKQEFQNMELESSWTTVATSQPVEFDLNPTWPLLKVRCADLCRCDMERLIRIRIWDYGQKGPDDQKKPTKVSMGHLDTTVRELMNRHMTHFEYDLTKFNDQMENVGCGKISVVSAIIEIESKGGASNERKVPRQRSASHLLGSRPEDDDDDDDDTDNEEEDEKPGGLLGGFMGRQQQQQQQNKPQQRRMTRRHSMESKTADKEKERVAREEEEKRKKKEEKPQPRKFIRLQLRGWELEELAGHRLLGEEDQPVPCSRAVGIGRFQMGVDDFNPFKTIHMTSVVPNDQNPLWDEIFLPIEDLAKGGDLDMPISLTAFEQGRTVMGFCQTTIRELLKDAKTNRSYTIQDNRNRNFGKIVIVKAELELEQLDDDTSSSSSSSSSESDDDSSSSSDEEELVGTNNNWLAQTLTLASGLWGANKNNNQQTEQQPVAEEEEQDVEAAKIPRPERNGSNRDTDKENIGSREDSKPISNTRQKEEEEESSDDDSDSDDDNDSVSTTDSDAITVADVVSLAEKSMQQASTPEQRQGLLELKLMLTPKQQVKPSAQSILGGMPVWTLDGDSVVGGSVGNLSHKLQQQQQDEQQQPRNSVGTNAGGSDLDVEEPKLNPDEKTSEEDAVASYVNSAVGTNAGDSTIQDLHVEEPKLYPDEKPSEEDTVACYVNTANIMVEGRAEKAEGGNQNVDLVSTLKDDEAILQHQVELSMQSNDVNEKSKRKKAKKVVKKTLKSIHRILKDNMISIPENEQAAAGDSAVPKPNKNRRRKKKGRREKKEKKKDKKERGRQRSGSQRGFRFRSRSRSGSQRGFRFRSRSRSGSQRGFRFRSRSPSATRKGFRSVSPTRKVMDRDRARGGAGIVQSLVEPPGEAQLHVLTAVRASDTRTQMAPNFTELRVESALAKNRSRSPTRRQSDSGLTTPQATQNGDILSGASGYDARVTRARSRSPSMRASDGRAVRASATSRGRQDGKKQEDVVDKLVGLGFDRDAATAAAIACNMDEQRAANFLMDRGGSAGNAPADGFDDEEVLEQHQIMAQHEATMPVESRSSAAERRTQSQSPSRRRHRAKGSRGGRADDEPGGNSSSQERAAIDFIHDAGRRHHRRGRKKKGKKSRGVPKADNQKKKEPEEENPSQVPSSSENPPLRSQEEVHKRFAPRLRREKIFRKNVTSFIRKAIKGEHVVTAIDGKQETKYQVTDDDSWLVCGKAAGEYYILTDEQFKTNYDTENAKEILPDNPYLLADRLRQQGFMEYRSSRKIWARKVTESDMNFFRHDIEDETNSDAFFMAPWGESVLVEEGDYIVMQYPEKFNEIEIYRIEHDVFHDSYVDDEEPEKEEEKEQPLGTSGRRGRDSTSRGETPQTEEGISRRANRSNGEKARSKSRSRRDGSTKGSRSRSKSRSRQDKVRDSTAGKGSKDSANTASSQNEVDKGKRNSPTRRPERTKSSDDGVPTRHKPRRTKSIDGTGGRSLARTKSNDDSGGKKKKGDSKPRKTASMDEGNMSFDTSNFTQQFAVHDSFPSPKEKNTGTRRRGSLSDVNQVGNSSTTKEKGNVKSMKLSPNRRGSLPDKKAAKQEKQDVEESMEIHQLEDPQHLFDADWASFPPPFPPKADKGGSPEAVRQSEDKPTEKQKAKKKKNVLPKRRASISGDLESRMKDRGQGLGKHISKSKQKLKQTPMQYLVSKGLSETEAQSVIEAAGINEMQDFAIMDDNMLSGVAKDAGLKPIPTKKLSNAIKEYTETLDSRSLPSNFGASSVKQGFSYMVGGISKVGALAGKGAYKVMEGTVSAAGAVADSGAAVVMSSTKSSKRSSNAPLSESQMAGKEEEDNSPKLEMYMSLQ